MRRLIKAVLAEAHKQHRNYFHSRMIYISLFVWPILCFITTYYSYQVFSLSRCKVPYLTEENKVVYLFIGYLCMSFFRSLVQSAWNFAQERVSGTLELIYLSPVNRMAIFLGNAISSLSESVFVMLIFGGFMLLFKRQYLYVKVLPCLILFFLITGMAILWGTFLNALFMFSRDSDFLFTILEEPMEIFSGVKVPTHLFPFWAKSISIIFPLTYALEAARQTLLTGTSITQMLPFIKVSILIMLILFLLTRVIILLVERHIRKTGNLTLF